MDIVWTEPARLNLREIFEYVAEDNVNAARKLLTEINERVLLLGIIPTSVDLDELKIQKSWC